MRTGVFFSGAVALALALVGCTEAEPESEPATQAAQPTEQIDDETATSAPEQNDASEASTAVPVGTSPEESVATDPPEPTDEEDELDLTQGAIALEDADFGDAGTNEYGETIKELGQWAGVSSADRELIVAALRVTEIDVDAECTSSEVQPPQNDHYIAVAFEVQVAPEYEDQIEHGFKETVWLTPSSLWVFDEEGELETGNSGNGYTCLPLNERLMPEIEPGEAFEGYLVLDSSLESGDITLPLSTIAPGAEGGWVWSF